jgi:hypothetical protein
MTVEIRELVIQAQVIQGENAAVTTGATPTLLHLARSERDRLVAEITRQVLEQLREEQERAL